MKNCILKDILLQEGGISQKELAIAAGLADNTVSKVATGKKVNERTVAKLVKGLNELTGKKFTMESLYVEK